MQLIRGLKNLHQINCCALTIGNFDGLHIGHQEIILQLKKKAKKLGLPIIIISFSNTPEDSFNKPVARLSNFREKYFLLKSFAVDKLILIRFNKSFASITAKKFIEEIIITKLRAKYCLIGEDFRFGNNRAGNFNMLKKYSKKGNFIIEKIADIKINNKRVSSSEIRNYLAAGNFERAQMLLGRPFSITGKVSHGEKKGRTMGFPTMNINIKRNVSPILGVFATIVEIRKKTYFGACNIGNRPTIAGKKLILEVFVFNFNKKVYGEEIKVIFKKHIREEKKFASLEMLKKQISEDKKEVEKFFKKNIN